MKISERHSTQARENLKRVEAWREARRTVKPCEQCGNLMTVSPSRVSRRFCSRKCRYEYMAGPNGPNFGKGEKLRGARNPLWKGGIAGERAAIYRQPEVQHWRRLVFYRDHYTCQRCHTCPNTHSPLRAHHIAPWAKYPELRFDVSNGITLCAACHKWVHSAANTAHELLKD